MIRGICPGSGRRSAQTEIRDEGLRFGKQGGEQVPPLLARGRDQRANGPAVFRPSHGSEAAGDFLPKPHHPPVAFGEAIGERHIGIDEEARHVGCSLTQPQPQVVSGSALGAPPSCGLGDGWDQRIPRLMEGEPFGANSLVASIDQRRQPRAQRRSLCAAAARGLAWAPGSVTTRGWGSGKPNTGRA